MTHSLTSMLISLVREVLFSADWTRFYSVLWAKSKNLSRCRWQLFLLIEYTMLLLWTKVRSVLSYSIIVGRYIYAHPETDRDELSEESWFSLSFYLKNRANHHLSIFVHLFPRPTRLPFRKWMFPISYTYSNEVPIWATKGKVSNYNTRKSFLSSCWFVCFVFVSLFLQTFWSEKSIFFKSIPTLIHKAEFVSTASKASRMGLGHRLLVYQVWCYKLEHWWESLMQKMV